MCRELKLKLMDDIGCEFELYGNDSDLAIDDEDDTLLLKYASPGSQYVYLTVTPQVFQLEIILSLGNAKTST